MNNLQSVALPTINTRISGKNQTVVPALIRHALKLKSGDTLLWRLIKVGTKQKIIAEPSPKHWATHSLGRGKDVWKKINIDEYITNLREEWDSQK